MSMQVFLLWVTDYNILTYLRDKKEIDVIEMAQNSNLKTKIMEMLHIFTGNIKSHWDL